MEHIRGVPKIGRETWNTTNFFLGFLTWPLPQKNGTPRFFGFLYISKSPTKFGFAFFVPKSWCSTFFLHETWNTTNFFLRSLTWALLYKNGTPRFSKTIEYVIIFILQHFCNFSQFFPFFLHNFFVPKVQKSNFFFLEHHKLFFRLLNLTLTSQKWNTSEVFQKSAVKHGTPQTFFWAS